MYVSISPPEKKIIKRVHTSTGVTKNNPKYKSADWKTFLVKVITVKQKCRIQKDVKPEVSLKVVQRNKWFHILVFSLPFLSGKVKMIGAYFLL